MADIFDEKKGLRRLQSKYRSTQEAGDQVLPAIDDAYNRIDAVDQNYVDNLSVVNRQVDTAEARSRTALDNLDKIERLPRIVSDVIGIFDEDYDREFQVQQVQRGQFEFQAAERDLQMFKQAREVAVNKALRDADKVEKFYNVTRQGFIDTSNLISMGINVERNVRQSHIDLVTDASLEELRAWQKSEDARPEGLKDKPGLIEVESLRRSMNLQQQELNDYTIKKQQRRAWLNEFNEAGQLEKYLQNPSMLPEYVGRQDIVDELNRRKEIRLGIRGAELANAQNEFDLMQDYRDKAIDQLNSYELENLLNQAREQKTNRVMIGKMEFTTAEIQQKMAEARKREDESDAIIAANEAAMAEAEAILATNEFTKNNLGQLYAPGQDAAGQFIPPHIKKKIAAAEAKADVLGDRVTENLGGINTYLDAVKDYDDVLQSAINEEVERYEKKSEQDAVRQFLENGAVTSTPIASRYLASAGGNPNMLDFNPVLSPVWRKLSPVLAKTVGSDVQSIVAGDEGFSVTKQDAPPETINVAKAIQESNATQIAANVAVQFAVDESINQLVSTSSPAARNTWGRIYNPMTGQYAREVYNENGQFDLSKFNILLAKETKRLQDEGVLGYDVSLQDIMLNKMRQNLKDFDAMWNNSLEASALKTVMFGPRQPSQHPTIGAALMQFEKQIPGALTVADEQRQAAKNRERIRSIPKLLEESIMGPMKERGNR